MKFRGEFSILALVVLAAAVHAAPLNWFGPSDKYVKLASIASEEESYVEAVSPFPAQERRFPKGAWKAAKKGYTRTISIYLGLILLYKSKSLHQFPWDEAAAIYVECAKNAVPKAMRMARRAVKKGSMIGVKVWLQFAEDMAAESGQFFDYDLAAALRKKCAENEITEHMERARAWSGYKYDFAIDVAEASLELARGMAEEKELEYSHEEAAAIRKRYMPNATPEEINDAMRKAVDYIKNQEKQESEYAPVKIFYGMGESEIPRFRHETPEPLRKFAGIHLLPPSVRMQNQPTKED